MQRRAEHLWKHSRKASAQAHGSSQASPRERTCVLCLPAFECIIKSLPHDEFISLVPYTVFDTRVPGNERGIDILCRGRSPKGASATLLHSIRNFITVTVVEQPPVVARRAGGSCRWLNAWHGSLDLWLSTWRVCTSAPVRCSLTTRFQGHTTQPADSTPAKHACLPPAEAGLRA